jgi:hypothetical protein
MSRIAAPFLRTNVLFITAISLKKQVFFGLEKVARAQKIGAGLY